MNRRHAHLLFGLSALAFALATGYQIMLLQRAERVNDAIALANSAALDNSVPEAVFARALILSNAGEASGHHDEAVKAYKEIIQGGRADLRQAALYNLGNLHMREVVGSDAGSAPNSLALVELAKQSYRDLLRENPADWDTRYNLERALWLAPELAEGGVEDTGPAPWQRRLITLPPGFKVELP